MAPVATAQQGRKVPLLGLLHPAFPPPSAGVPTVELLREGLRSMGYVEGKTIAIETRWGHGKPETLPGLAAELVRLNVDVLVAVGPAAVIAAKRATAVLPIIAVDLETGPVASGLVANLRRPGGNLTGLFLDLPDVTGKWLQLIE